MTFNIKKTCFALLLLSMQLGAQSSANEIWTTIKEREVNRRGERQIVPMKYQTFRLNLSALKQTLATAPSERNKPVNLSSCIITLPMPDGTTQRFRVVNSPIMTEELAAAYPDIQTYSIKGIDNTYANGKIDWNEFGFHAMVLSPEGNFFVDPYCLNNTADYISYYTNDFVKDPAQILPEAGLITGNEGQRKPIQTSTQGTGAKPAAVPVAPCVGTQLKSYRLAVACTGEYAVAATGQTGPSVAQTLAKIVTSVNRVDGVYETEVAVRLVLVSTETAVVFTSGSSDPFNGNNNANTLIGESQTVITNAIGSANFDIGHTFSTGGGGLAYLGCVCNNTNKARGITGSPSPVGDPYDIDYVAHEMGHQFGGEHTFNAITGSCNGNRSTNAAVEPGSGITIMAYAGICGNIDNLGSHSIPYFHAISYDQIVNFTGGLGLACASSSATVNHPPVVNPLTDYVIPFGTPFYLTGSATDPDGDPLTYSWEETDIGTSAASWNAGVKPYFMSYAPTILTTRYFPKASVVAAGNYTNTRGEYLTSSPQALKFRLTARDGKMGGGGVCSANMNLTVDASGPFVVTYPSATGISWVSGTSQNVTWDVNGTDSGPVSCDSVKVLISYNSGNSYSVLLGSTANDGIESITVPTVTASIFTCRIRVESKGNVFYDIGNNDFTISTATDVGVPEISSSNAVGLSAWPNPATTVINVSAANLDAASETLLSVTDVVGKELMHINYGRRGNLVTTTDVSALAAGVYYLRVSNSSRAGVYRIIKQ